MNGDGRREKEPFMPCGLAIREKSLKRQASAQLSMQGRVHGVARFYDFRSGRLSGFAIDLVSQFTGAFKRHDLTLAKNQVRSCGRVSAPSLFLILDAEFAKARYQDIIAFLQGILDDFEQGFDDIHSFFLGKTEFMNFCHNVTFR
jgi:hypothetical protein